MTHYTPKRLKLVQTGYEGYNGPIGEYEFADGVSVEHIPLVARDRLSAAFQMVEVDDEGDEQEASVAARLVREKVLSVEPTEPLSRMSDEEKAVENITVLLGSEAAIPLYSRAALEAVAGAGGIAAVRVLAEPWDVRSKSIPDLINQIERAQMNYRTDRIEALVRKGVSTEEAEALFALREDAPGVEPKVKPKAEVAAEPVAEPAPAASPALNEAAATGDLAAALNAE